MSKLTHVLALVDIDVDVDSDETASRYMVGMVDEEVRDD
jgi:hypothetical protein